MAKPVRSAQRAAAVIDRAARMTKSKVPLLERRLFDTQMPTPGYMRSAPSMNRIDPKDLKRLGIVEVPLSKVRTEQPSVSVAEVKAKLSGVGARTDNMTPGPVMSKLGGPWVPQAVKSSNGTWWVNDGNHRITAARAMGQTTIRVAGAEATGASAKYLDSFAGAAAPRVAKVASAYRRISPAMQVGGIVAAGSTAFMSAREHNASLGEAISTAGKAMAPGVVTMAGAAALARIAPAAAGVLGKVNPVVFGGAVAYNAARGAWEGYHAPARDRTWGEWAKGQQPPKAGWMGALRGGAFGAADTLTFGIASAVAGRSREVKVPKDWDPVSGGRKQHLDTSSAGPMLEGMTGKTMRYTDADRQSTNVEDRRGEHPSVDAKRPVAEPYGYHGRIKTDADAAGVRDAIGQWENTRAKSKPGSPAHRAAERYLNDAKPNLERWDRQGTPEQSRAAVGKQFEDASRIWQGKTDGMGTAKDFQAADAKFQKESALRGEPAGPTRAGYKDTWSDSRGRNYTRRNMAVRTRQDMKEAA